MTPPVHPATVVQSNRRLWAAVNEAFADRDADRRWRTAEITWGLFERPESELEVLGNVTGRQVAELGCGTAYLSASLVRAGAHPVAVDLSHSQLQTARRNQTRTGIGFPLVEADATQVPLRASSFDLVVSDYGAAPWCDPHSWLGEAARILRPDGRLVFLTNSVLAGLCVPADGGVAGERLLRGQRDLRHIAWPGGGVEHHASHGDWIRELRAAGFVVDALHELYAPPGAVAPEYYDIVTAEWARRWPAEDLWVAHVTGTSPGR